MNSMNPVQTALLATTLVASLLSAAETSVSAQAQRIEKPGVYSLDEDALIADGWNRIFRDNFKEMIATGATLDSSKWTIWTGGAFNNELQYYQAANVQLFNGDLEITAREEQVIGGLIYPGAQPPNNTRDFAYTSGRVESVEHWRGSDYAKVRIYARIKLNTHDYGLWPAVWTYGDTWPLKGEIDIFEAKVDLNGQPPAWYQTNYFYGTSPGVSLVEQPAAASPPFYTDLSDDYYHVVMVEWTENELRFEFDGMPVDTKTYVGPNDPYEYIPEFWHKRQRIVLNLAYGGIFFGSTPITPGSITNATMKVDWVQVFVK